MQRLTIRGSSFEVYRTMDKLGAQHDYVRSICYLCDVTSSHVRIALLWLAKHEMISGLCRMDLRRREAADKSYLEVQAPHHRNHLIFSSPSSLVPDCRISDIPPSLVAVQHVAKNKHI